MKPGGAVYSPEFDLVLACLRWPQEAVDGDRIRTLAQQPIRWPHLLEIVDHHKVVPLFSRNLETFAPGYMPDEQAAALRASSVANAHICLERSRASRRPAIASSASNRSISGFSRAFLWP